MASSLPSSINDERFRAFLKSVERLAGIELNIINIWDIDNIDESVLIHLADQFNAIGYRGWLLCETLEDKRNLIKKTALELHRVAGTAYSIASALRSVGYSNVEVVENPVFLYDGRYAIRDTPKYYNEQFSYDNAIELYDGFSTVDTPGFYNGAEYYSGKYYARFIVKLNLDKDTFTAEEEGLVVKLIEEWKNARSHLLELQAFQSFDYNGELIYNGGYFYVGNKGF